MSEISIYLCQGTKYCFCLHSSLPGIVLTVELVVKTALHRNASILATKSMRFCVELIVKWSCFLIFYMLIRNYTLCSKKTCDHIFDDKLKQNYPFTKIFGTLITNSISHRQVYLVSHLTYFVHLLYLGKLSRPKYHEFSLKFLIFSMLQY